MKSTYLIIGVILLVFGLVMASTYLIGQKKHIPLIEKYSKYLLIGSICLFLVGTALFIASFFDSKKTIYASPVLIGTALVYNGTKINLSQIIDKIDIFWDWQLQYSPENYDIPANSVTDIKFIPMIWCSGNLTNHNDFIQLNSNSKYIFSWNEPDMLGTDMGYDQTSKQDKLSSCGWISDPVPKYTTDPLLVYGNMIPGGIYSTSSATDITNTMYPQIATVLNKQADYIKSHIQGVKLATPVMAMDADISLGCAGYAPLIDDAIGLCNGNKTVNGKQLANICSYNGCPTGCPNVCNGLPLAKTAKDACQSTCYLDRDGKKNNGCYCNGWLSLVKASGVDGANWWNKNDIINIHAYSRYAHSIKLKLIGYLFIFPTIIKKTYNPTTKQYSVDTGYQELWLTECGCIPTPDDVSKMGDEQINSAFIRDLLWNSTSITKDMKQQCPAITDSYGAPTYLPGLRSTDTFTYQGKTGSWYEHGFGAFTWFTGQLNGFDVGCGPHVGTINSSVWDNQGRLNDVWKALTEIP